jgi:AraC family transcriptional regulator
MSLDRSQSPHATGSALCDTGPAMDAGTVPFAERSDTVTRALVQLLESAGKALSRSPSQAHAYIAQATALLRFDNGTGSATPHSTVRSFRGGLARWQLRRVIEFVDANLNHTIRMSDVAAKAGLSTSYFFHAFRSTVGESPYAYVVRRRIERAQQLMLRTEKTLSEIALDCGLSDQAHLTRRFKRLAGVSPGAWRRLRRALQTNAPAAALGEHSDDRAQAF